MVTIIRHYVRFCWLPCHGSMRERRNGEATGDVRCNSFVTRFSYAVPMVMYSGSERLVIFDADGTLIDAFHAIEQTFLSHGMAIGDLERFQKRRKLLNLKISVEDVQRG